MAVAVRLFSRMPRLRPQPLAAVAVFAAVAVAQQRDFTWADRGVDAITGEATSAESKTQAAAAYSKSKLFKHDPYSIETSRKAFVLIGVTGAGKSATANTVCGAKRCFETASSVASVTSAVRVRDYSFAGSRWRVIDTPGLGDTHKSPEVTKAELLEAFRYARHGIVCFVVVVPKGRLTAEIELRVREALEVFGGNAVLPYTLIAVTRSQDAPEKLVDEIMRLLQEHALRRLCHLVGHRVVPMENVKEPAVLVSRLLLHKAVDEVLEMNGEERYFQPHSVVLGSGGGQGGQALDLFSAGLPQSQCSSKWTFSDRRHPRLTITCDFPETELR